MSMKDRNQVVIDIETGGTKVNAIVYDIGLAILMSNEIHSIFTLGVEEASCFNLGGQYDKDTQEWWGRQSLEAKELRGSRNKDTIRETLHRLNHILESHKVEISWGNSPSFDQSILLWYYKELGIPPDPSLTYRNQMDLRTLTSLYPYLKEYGKGLFLDKTNSYIQHVAMDDAIVEARTLIHFYDNSSDYNIGGE